MNAIAQIVRVATVLFMACLANISTVSPGHTSTIVGGFTVLDTFNFVVARQPNDAGVAVGTGDLVGIDVTPIGCQPNVPANCTGPTTTVTASQGAFSNLAVPYLFSNAVPNEFATFVRALPTGVWTLSLMNPAVNGGAAATIQTAALQTTAAPPFVNSVNLVGNGLTPTINWSLPPSDPATKETVFIRDRSVVTPDGHPIVYESAALPRTTTSFMVPSGVLVDTHQYTFSVQQDVVSHGNLIARSVAFVDFGQDNSLPLGTVIQLPVVVINGNAPFYSFDFPVGPGQTYYLDPSIVAGYLYQTAAGDPLFASVSLPSLGAGISYTLCLPQASTYACDVPLAPDQTYDFLGAGVTSFEVLLDGANLDPLAGLPFVTAVSFEGVGNFTGSITTLVAQVPEPASAAILGLGLPGLLVVRARRKMRAFATEGRAG